MAHLFVCLSFLVACLPNLLATDIDAAGLTDVAMASMNVADSDGDGKATKDELITMVANENKNAESGELFMDFIERQFGTKDVDEDGMLDVRELAALLGDYLNYVQERKRTDL
eukprot:TRINITY_DN60833_c0_g1_i1.p1 TRINITY_DN60833_c0_g1~~TRINITY_DN60833_c0_g1_i1.p1  ORF type:complete len:113 (+),score=25.16 TRINITY_DN60833_c0_g1_i1:53-391(+)